MQKIILKMIFFSNAVFAKTLENVRYESCNSFEATRNYLVSKPDYHTNTFHKNTQIFINKPVYLGLSMLEVMLVSNV